MTDEKKHKRVEFSALFNRNITHAPPDMKVAFQEAYELFAEYLNHPALRNHILTGKYQDFRSIDVTKDWRALYRTEPERIIFVALGTHETLYGEE